MRLYISSYSSDCTCFKCQYDITLDVTGTKPIRLTIQDNDFKATSWTSCLVIFLNHVWKNDSETYDRIKKDSSVGQCH